MQLTSEQLKDVENLGALNYAPEKIAMMLAVDKGEFLSDFDTPDSDPAYHEGHIKYHYDAGQLRSQQKVDSVILKLAEEGNQTAIQQYKKDIRLREIENAKRNTVYQESKLTLDAVHKAIEGGDTTDVPPNLIAYASQIEYINNLFLKLNSRQFIVEAVRKRWPSLTFRLIASLYYDSITFFNSKNEVTVETWTRIYAERMDNLHSLALALNDVKGAKDALKEAATMRGVGKVDDKTIPKALLLRKRQVHTMDITKIGLPQVDKKQLTDFIEKLDLTVRQKERYKRESGVKGTPLQIFPQNEE